ncbi:unnamed protein product [Symbiodinium sp. CCMP2592]|nr:unnamed protein product [Symbiodinium sp. CCMP2592]CAE6942155.1 unnamed protein product [Symbiodinium sp. CCMP2592]CAE6958866.1 unnamed protein product [Symbiodinium sp. CCMP2592]CAE7267512.1 unnamed protein product [Symbiodinium sp. CCMP2592]CAE7269373.1 unnamed protein product [Symbiodinium sp. CCMP2592]
MASTKKIEDNDKEEVDDLAKQLLKLQVGGTPERSEAEQLKELGNLLNRPVRELAGWWSLCKQTGYCLHCSRCYIIEFLSLKEIAKFDSLWHDDFECRCEMDN